MFKPKKFNPTTFEAIFPEEEKTVIGQWLIESEEKKHKEKAAEPSKLAEYASQYISQYEKVGKLDKAKYLKQEDYSVPINGYKFEFLPAFLKWCVKQTYKEDDLYMFNITRLEQFIKDKVNYIHNALTDKNSWKEFGTEYQVNVKKNNFLIKNEKIEINIPNEVTTKISTIKKKF